MTSQRRFALRLALCLGLLFAQHIAVAHQARHLFDPASDLQLEGDKGILSGSCAFHGLFDGLLSAVDPAAPELALAGADVHWQVPRLRTLVPAEPVRSSSRDPPFSAS